MAAGLFKMKTHFLIFFAGLFWTGNMVAQFCSPGNPVGGTASVGTVQKGSLRSITFFRHSFSDTFYDETKEAEFQDTKA
ncbi:MAG: hypothetical protein ABIT06_01235, partial [Saprospiraceae bacterium]